ncbi:UNVERIFIED_CONTAM: hypothetical protein Sangu_0393900 [Sesamum angustifolium]|uniref:Uncharacterized protein n=1 Tax=Sesamum angustifolium TaxID=2727405 RepID=A0AAW2QSV3_9LAMI
MSLRKKVKGIRCPCAAGRKRLGTPLASSAGRPSMDRMTGVHVERSPRCLVPNRRNALQGTTGCPLQ